MLNGDVSLTKVGYFIILISIQFWSNSETISGDQTTDQAFVLRELLVPSSQFLSLREGSGWSQRQNCLTDALVVAADWTASATPT